jgi:hypothetical protein
MILTCSEPELNRRATQMQQCPNQCWATWKKVCSLDKQELLRYGEEREGQVAAFHYTCKP